MRSIDIFRGITVALMILVNSLDGKHGIAWLEHAPWHGCTLADLVFPFFIFIVGVSVTLSISKLQNIGVPSQQLLHKM